MTQTFQKDFDAWAKVAQRVEQHSYPAHLKIGAIYWCHLGATIGSELSGKNTNFTRPVLVLANLDNRLVLVIPTTSKTKSGANYFPIYVSGRPEHLALLQTRPIDIKRLENFIDEIDSQTLTNIRKAYLHLLKTKLYKKSNPTNFV